MTDDFLGTFTSSVNKEKWITLPSSLKKKFTANAKKTVIVTIGPNQNVAVYPLDNWKDKLERLKNGDDKALKLRMTLRHFAAEEKVEDNGRVKIPSNLITLAKIEKKVIVKGDGTYIAIWNPEHFAVYDSEQFKMHTSLFSSLDYQ